MNHTITVEVTIHAPIEKIWESWTKPEYIQKWCFASDDWCAPRAMNDLKVGGVFTTRMEAKDGSMGFDFNGVYTVIEEQKRIHYTIEGGRKVTIDFIQEGDAWKVIETFDPEDENPPEMQKAGWQAILENFKKYTETSFR